MKLCRVAMRAIDGRPLHGRVDRPARVRCSTGPQVSGPKQSRQEGEENARNRYNEHLKAPRMARRMPWDRDKARADRTAPRLPPTTVARPTDGAPWSWRRSRARG